MWSWTSNLRPEHLLYLRFSLNTGHKTFSRCPGRFLNVLRAFNYILTYVRLCDYWAVRKVETIFGQNGQCFPSSEIKAENLWTRKICPYCTRNRGITCLSLTLYFLFVKVLMTSKTLTSQNMLWPWLWQQVKQVKVT